MKTYKVYIVLVLHFERRFRQIASDKGRETASEMVTPSTTTFGAQDEGREHGTAQECETALARVEDDDKQTKTTTEYL